MLSNLHSHSKFCDGSNSLEEMLLSAINKGFDSFGFSGHGHTDFDLTYCMKETDKYIEIVNNLKVKYKDKIQVYLGVEEDAFCPVKNRGDFDYIIGSNHYILKDGTYYPVDSNPDCFAKILDLFNGNFSEIAENYYSSFCKYLKGRKPDIIGHFDLITKYDEIGTCCLRADENYNKIAEKYVKEALKYNCLFEVNTGAISRKCRTPPYPDERLLYIIKKENGRVILSSDTHSIETIDCYFDETRKILKDIGFQYVYVLYNKKFVKDEL